MKDETRYDYWYVDDMIPVRTDLKKVKAARKVFAVAIAFAAIMVFIGGPPAFWSKHLLLLLAVGASFVLAFWALGAMAYIFFTDVRPPDEW